MCKLIISNSSQLGLIELHLVPPNENILICALMLPTN
jgi:hypothetical protein